MLILFLNPWQPIWSAKFIRAQISNDELIICNLIVSGWTRTMMEVWRKRSSWRVASKMTSCRRCWPPTWPRRWGALTKSDWVGRRPWTWCKICECARLSVIFAGASTCILVHLTPNKLGPTWMIARRLFSIPLQCSSDWPDFTMWILTSSASLSVTIDQPVGSSLLWSISWSCKNYHPLSSLYCIANTSQPGLATTLLTMYFFSQYCRQYPQEIFSTILSTTYFLSGLCVWRIYVYFLIICYDIWRYIS